MSPFILFIFTKVASTATLIISLFFLFLLLIKRNVKKSAISLLIISVSFFAALMLTKNYFKTARPTDALISTTGYAFPSGHAAGVTFLAFVASYLVWKLYPRYKYQIIILSIFFTVTISYSRILLQVHTWLQVIAGLAFGIIFGLLFIYLSKKSS